MLLFFSSSVFYNQHRTGQDKTRQGEGGTVTCKNDVQKHLDDLDVELAEGTHTVQTVFDAILIRNSCTENEGSFQPWDELLIVLIDGQYIEDGEQQTVGIFHSRRDDDQLEGR